METPLISIIIPTYNRAHLIGETLDSVLAQTYQNWECIVVDDGSTDDTEEVVGAFIYRDSRFQLHHRPHNILCGGNGARNYGAELAIAKYIIFFDSDDLFINTALENRMKVISKYGDSVDMLINNTGVFRKKLGDSDLLWNLMNATDSNVILLKRFLNMDMPWCTNSVTWSYKFFKSTGGWNTTLTAWQDWELHIIALLKNPTVMHFDKFPDNYYRIEGGRSIKDNFKTLDYYNSVRKAFYNVCCELQSYPLIKESVNEELKKLAIIILIKMPVVHHFRLEPLRNFNKFRIVSGIKKSLFWRFYIIEFFGQSTKVRLYLIKSIYSKQQNYMRKKQSFMKFTHQDLYT